jgi:lysophospholipase L1-like esterase
MHGFYSVFLGAMLIAAAAAPEKHRIWVLGDSTLSVYDASVYPRKGWAQVLQERFNADSVEIRDKALSGRSSKSFYTDKAGWPAFKDQIRAGDYVVVEFGHNDEKTDTALSTLPGSTFEQYLSLYIDFAKKVGAIPILATPIQRNSWNGDGKTMSQSHVIAGRGDYPQAIRNLAASRNVALVDMTKLTEDFLEGIGKAAATKLYLNLAPGAYPNYPDGNTDNTHLHENGARAFANLFAENLVSRKLAPIGNWVKGANPVAIPSDAAAARLPDEIASAGDGMIRINCKKRISAFSILKIDGQVENDRGKAIDGNILPLTSKSGSPLPPGQYVLRYQISGGATRSALIADK